VSALNPDAVHHADRCEGVPVIAEDRLGQFEAVCSIQRPEFCDWEVSGCESRAEAGAAFYGHDPRGNW
jgi:hypothetical protein